MILVGSSTQSLPSLKVTSLGYMRQNWSTMSTVKTKSTTRLMQKSPSIVSTVGAGKKDTS